MSEGRNEKCHIKPASHVPQLGTRGLCQHQRPRLTCRRSGLPHQPERKHTPAQGHSQGRRKEKKPTISARTKGVQTGEHPTPTLSANSDGQNSRLLRVRRARWVNRGVQPRPSCRLGPRQRTAEELGGRGTAQRCNCIP